MVLADMGAEVIKIEPLGHGDHTRDTAPFINGESAGFLALNRNKHSVAVNLKDARGRQIYLDLARTADVILENFRPGTMKDLGIDYESIKAIKPDIIYCSVSGFGQTGPYSQRPGLDLIVQGMSGLMSITGEPGGAPVKAGAPVADLTAALYAAFGILSAYIHRQRTGEGQYIDVSLFESAVALGVWETSGYFASGEVPERLGSAHRVTAPYQAFATSDGYVTIGANTNAFFARLCAVLDKSELQKDPRFGSVADRKRNDVDLAEIIESVTRGETSQHWYELLEKAGIPCGVLNTYAQVVEDRHLKERGFIIDVEHPVAGATRATGFPAGLHSTPPRLFRPAPVLGAETEHYLREIGRSDADIEALRADGVI
jgi:formyl-CoA transferase